MSLIQDDLGLARLEEVLKLNLFRLEYFHKIEVEEGFVRKQVVPVYCVSVFLLIFTIIFLGLTAVPSNSILASSCRPNEGWTWTGGPPQIGLALLAQQRLREIGVAAEVEATSFGETDSCGSFKLYEIDFTVSVNTYDFAADLNLQDLSDTIYEALAKFQKTDLGDVKIVFPDNTIVFKNSQIELQEQIFNNLAIDSTWQQLTTSTSPPGRYTHGMTFDSARGAVVLFGGDSTGVSRLNDTWEYNGINWMQVSPSQSPPGRANIDQTLVFDSYRAKTILFGGLGASGYLNDTWEYNGTTWTEISASLSPASRDSHAMAFDNQRNVTVLFGGYSSGTLLNDTWEYNGAWSEVDTLQEPSARYHHALAYDEDRNAIVLFGGHDNTGNVLGDTWEYDGANWTKITPLQSPQPRENHSLTYDKARDVIVLFGGESNGEILHDTWEYDGKTWRQIATEQAPLNRKETSLVYDDEQEQVLLFGGGNWSRGSLTAFAETWAYTGSSSTLPLEVFNRNVYVIVYDPILSGGESLSTYLGWNNHADLTQETIDFFKQATGDRLIYNVVETTVVTDGWPELNDGYVYTEEVYLDVLDGQIPPPTTSMVNYNKIVNSAQFNICDKVNNGEVDEVWIYNGPWFGFYESTLVGPGAYWYNSPPVPGPHHCQRLVPIMGPSPERGIDSAVHNFGHRTEATMTQVYGSWFQNRTAHNWERFTLVDSLSPNYSYSGCGNIHFPPNGTSDYDYQNLSVGNTNCNDFANYPELGELADTIQPVTCSEWGCTQIGYLGYWFGHLPSNAGCADDIYTNDWWRYFINPELALDPSVPCFQFHVFLPNVLR